MRLLERDKNKKEKNGFFFLLSSVITKLFHKDNRTLTSALIVENVSKLAIHMVDRRTNREKLLSSPSTGIIFQADPISNGRQYEKEKQRWRKRININRFFPVCVCFLCPKEEIFWQLCGRISGSRRFFCFFVSLQ